MAGYSGTPLPRKLGIKPGAMVATLDAPADFAATLGELPPGAVLHPFSGGPAEVALLFARERAALETGFGRLAIAIRPAGGLWVCWPKKASGIATDLDENVIREFGLGMGLVDNKVCAVDETWSGLRFVYRVKDR
jgi:hypothetical protein